jgi:hypothetical protein
MDDDCTGQQPEALNSLKAAARAGSQKPDGQGLAAKGETAPEAESLEAEQADAAEILKQGAEEDTGKPSPPPRG